MNAEQRPTQGSPSHERSPAAASDVAPSPSMTARHDSDSGVVALLPARPEQAADAPRASSASSKGVAHGAIVLHYHRNYHRVVGETREPFPTVWIGKNVYDLEGFPAGLQFLNCRRAIWATGFDVDGSHRSRFSRTPRSAAASLFLIVNYHAAPSLLQELPFQSLGPSSVSRIVECSVSPPVAAGALQFLGTGGGIAPVKREAEERPWP